MDATAPVFDTRHLIVPDEGRLSEILPPMLELSTERVSELLHLGSVYLNKKRVIIDQVIPSLSYVRVHCKPKRYEVSKIDWKNAVIFENEHMAVVNKPTGFPVPSAVDNIRETVVAQVQIAINHKLFVTQRLDVLTCGLFVFAKTIAFQRGFNHLLSEGRLYKEYLARTSGRPGLGLHTHFMKPILGSPKEVYAKAESPEWKECRLEILESEAKGEVFNTRIRLLTGRTHQIRAQLSALSCPLWGDKLYSGPGPQSEYSLVSKFLRFECPILRQSFEFVAP